MSALQSHFLAPRDRGGAPPRNAARRTDPGSPLSRLARTADGHDSLARYSRDIAAYPPLSVDEELALATRIRDGDREAVDALVRANLRFVVTVARRYQDHGVPIEDLINEGNLGLLRGAARFDGSKGARFITYAVWWIRQALFTAVAEQGRPVRVPPRVAGTTYRIRRRATALRRTLGRDATPAEIAAAAGVTEEEVAIAAAITRRHLSLDAPIAPGADVSLLDRLTDASGRAPDEQAMEVALVEAVEASVAALPDREALVVRLYFGLDGEDPRTLEQIGALFGVTRERVRQIKSAALAKLRAGQTGATLAEFY
jgi:RNA polymerase primary sigma factor